MQSCIGSFPKEIGRWKASVLKNEGRDDVLSNASDARASVKPRCYSGAISSYKDRTDKKKHSATLATYPATRVSRCC
ncbi:hypothetical protein GN244_ATG12424 [Phytophthora infestans]|uniref:Uncharacterized protein n=1 Tax=Phytophthora infestans TaxID=4787 RepID=A0A833SJM6_PHYIN|nr:hypothetical protein GN244_ATG12424 [Phytophthora infestans]